MDRSNRRQKEGVIVSISSKKTVTVLCEQKQIHPKYKKVVKKFSKFKAHDEKNEAKKGDKVLIEETRPMSAGKYFRVVKILGSGAIVKRELPKKKEKELEASDTSTNAAASS